MRAVNEGQPTADPPVAPVPVHDPYVRALERAVWNAGAVRASVGCVCWVLCALVAAAHTHACCMSLWAQPQPAPRTVMDPNSLAPNAIQPSALAPAVLVAVAFSTSLTVMVALLPVPLVSHSTPQVPCASTLHLLKAVSASSSWLQSKAAALDAASSRHASTAACRACILLPPATARWQRLPARCPAGSTEWSRRSPQCPQSPAMLRAKPQRTLPRVLCPSRAATALRETSGAWKGFRRRLMRRCALGRRAGRGCFAVGSLAATAAR